MGISVGFLEGADAAAGLAAAEAAGLTAAVVVVAAFSGAAEVAAVAAVAGLVAAEDPSGFFPSVSMTKKGLPTSTDCPSAAKSSTITPASGDLIGT